MSGTINLALSQQFDMDGEPLGGGRLYFFAAGTTTPQSAFQDVALTIAHPNPIVLDASGRVPMFYLADGNIKIRLTDDTGVTVIAADNLLVIGPSSGGGGGGAVDPFTVLQAGDIKVKFGTGTLDGFVRCNGRTIGSATSSATERASADCQTLFEYLWSTTVLGVFAGATPSRGATANADWIANKQIALPDMRGRVIAGMDDMGATAASRLTAAGLGIVATVLGNAGATETLALSTAQLPVHAHTQQGAFGTSNELQAHTHQQQGTFGSSGQSQDHTHAYTRAFSAAGASGGGLVSNTTSDQTGGASNDHTHSTTIFGPTGLEDQAHNHSVTISGNTQNAGSGSAHSSVQPTMCMTVYIKL